MESLPRPLPYTHIDLTKNGFHSFDDRNAGVRSVARGLRLGYHGAGGRGLEGLVLRANPLAETRRGYVP